MKIMNKKNNNFFLSVSMILCIISSYSLIFASNIPLPLTPETTQTKGHGLSIVNPESLQLCDGYAISYEDSPSQMKNQCCRKRKLSPGSSSNLFSHFDNNNKIDTSKQLYKAGILCALRL
jgi:hypothetical protein